MVFKSLKQDSYRLHNVYVVGQKRKQQGQKLHLVKVPYEFSCLGENRNSYLLGMTRTATLLPHAVEFIVLRCLLEKYFQSEESHVQCI